MTQRGLGARLFGYACALVVFVFAGRSQGAGVTVITHGYGGAVDGWVNAMAEAIPRYYTYPGTNFTLYTMKVTYSGGSYRLATTRTKGSAPFENASGHIIVKLDWNELAGGILTMHDTYDVATAVGWGLQQTNLIGELQGHALAEFPLHFIGHSRGGSLLSETSRLLGAQGVWVDHLTTLDPHPLNQDGFNDFPLAAVDAPVRTYENILFHDNYYQELGSGLTDPKGEPVAGAYSRRLTSLGGGYPGQIAPNHSNVHLWYHGTIDFAVPASDTEASIGNTERDAWWTSYETRGTVAGFLYSLVGRGDRLSGDQPVGLGFSAIRDGYNQWWDLGAGTASNRTALASNAGLWPNPIRFYRLDTNAVLQGGSLSARLYWQWAQPATSTGNVRFCLDEDLNPLNSNERLLGQAALAGTGSGSVSLQKLNLNLNATNAPVGEHALCVQILAGGRTRYLYAPEMVKVLPAWQPPNLQISQAPAGRIQIAISGPAGQKVILDRSPNLSAWTAVATNVLGDVPWVYSEAQASDNGFYRAR